MGTSISTINDSPLQALASTPATLNIDTATPMRPPPQRLRCPELPPEVWTLIMSYTRELDDQAHRTTREPGRRRLDGPTPKTLDTVGNRTTLALASTCRLIRSVADPFLWDRLSFYLPCVPEPPDPTADPDPQNVQLVQERGKDFLTFLKRNPEIRDVVTEFTIYVGDDTPQDDGSRPLVELLMSLSRLMVMLPKLESISISGASMPLEILLSICHLGARIKHLSISNCRWPTFPTNLKSSNLRLRSLRVVGGKWIQRWLDQFMTFTDVLEDVELDDSFPGTTIKRFPKLKRLSVKEVNRRDTDRFCRTLSHCPNLEDLTIIEAMMDPNFTKTCLPHLHALRGNILNCVFIEDRPVETVELSYPTLTPWGQDLELDIVLRRVLEVCSSGSVPIISFKMTTGTCGERYRWGDVEILALVEVFPYLELLDVDINPDTFYESTSYAARLVNLRALCWRLPRTPERLTMEWQVQHKDALMMIGNLRNTLTNFAFVDGVEWVRGINGWYALDHLAAS